MGALRFFVFVIIVCVAILAFNAFTRRRCDDIYVQIDNDNDVQLANRYISSMSLRYRKDPIDNYRLGNLYDFVLRDNAMATNYYIETIDQLRRDNALSNRFIIDRLMDRVNINRNLEHDDNQIGIHEITELEHGLADLEAIVERRQPEKRAPETLVRWESDGQNVHDSNINDEISMHFEEVRRRNIENGTYIWRFRDIAPSLRNVDAAEIGEYERGNISAAIKMLNHIDRYNAQLTKLECDKRTFVRHIYSFIQAEKDPEVRRTMLENFIFNLKDSYTENGTIPVCVAGQVSRIISSLSHCDPTNEALGTLNSKQIIKNQIYMKAGEIRDRIMDVADAATIEKYNEGVQDDDVAALEQEITSTISRELQAEYTAVDGKWLNAAIDEVNSYI